MAFTEVGKLEDGTIIVKDENGNLLSIEKIKPLKVQESETRTTARKIKAILKELKIPQENSGFNYLITAISLLGQNPEYYSCIVDVLYPKVANLHKKENSSMIERCIRHAISKVDKTTDMYHNIFGGISTLTNKRFLVTIANYLND